MAGLVCKVSLSGSGGSVLEGDQGCRAGPHENDSSGVCVCGVENHLTIDGVQILSHLHEW